METTIPVILGERDYEKTATGKYPKYNLEQMNLYVTPNCEPYTAIQMIINIISFDLFGKYKNELTPEQKITLDEKVKERYGLHNLNFDDIADYEKCKYLEESSEWVTI